MNSDYHENNKKPYDSEEEDNHGVVETPS